MLINAPIDVRGAATGSSWPGNLSGQDSLTASYTISATNVWEDSGLEIALPSAGNYALYSTLFGSVTSSNANGIIYARFYDNTNNAVVTNSETMVVSAATASTRANASITMVNIFTCTSNGANIAVQVLRGPGLGLTYSLSIIQYVSGFSSPRMGYIKLS